MPPPKASTERRRDRQAAREVKQTPDELARLVGAAYWEDGRFDKTLGYGVTDGFVGAYRGGPARGDVRC